MADLTEEIKYIIDQACWDARRHWGHDDNGLDVDGDCPECDCGKQVRYCECDCEIYHPEAVKATQAVMKLLEQSGN